MKMRNNHYDVDGPGDLAAKREALFALPSARGNAPHLTTEDADHEGVRRNAERYETVEQMDRSLDRRARALAPRPQRASTALGAVPTTPPSGAGFGYLAALLFFAAGAALAYTLAKRGDLDDDAAEAPPAPEPPAAQPLTQTPAPQVLVQNPAPAPAPVVNPAPVSVSVTQTATPAPAPVESEKPEQPPVVMEPPRRARRRPRAAR